ncbi:hypothetical protein Droror1_Dr00001233 [Drosera rotundifolia]
MMETSREATVSVFAICLGSVCLHQSHQVASSSSLGDDQEIRVVVVSYFKAQATTLLEELRFGQSQGMLASQFHHHTGGFCSRISIVHSPITTKKEVKEKSLLIPNFPNSLSESTPRHLFTFPLPSSMAAISPAESFVHDPKSDPRRGDGAAGAEWFARRLCWWLRVRLGLLVVEVCGGVRDWCGFGCARSL